MNKEELTLLGTLGAVGALIGIAKLLVSDEPLKPRQVIGRALLHAGLGVASAGILVLRFPHISSCEIKRLVGQAVEEGARMGHASR
ncbi:phage holin family protein [Xanthomonas citri]|uniref:phage holin family protein n=1 Tax=Xanthomonas citri TaxID=346 RepID=UPI0007297A19|nr:phage holin family protein [Xanthomonas citri]CEF23516.1 putative Holin [Xanthomonas citri pv. citri]